MPLCEICAGLLFEAFSGGPRFAVTGKFCHARQYAEASERCDLCRYIHNSPLDESNDFIERLKHLDRKEILDVAFGKLDRIQPSGFVSFTGTGRVSDENRKKLAMNALLTFSVREGWLARLLRAPSEIFTSQ